MIGRLVYGPPEWVVDRFPARERRAFGFWTFIASAVLAVPFGRSVLFVTLISVLALVSTFTAETPVEEEP